MIEAAIGSFSQAFALIAGLPLLGLGLWWTWRRWSLRRDGLRAVVRIVGYETSRDIEDAGDWHHPVVEFGGQNHVLTMGERRQRWPVGTPVPVRYRPHQIERMVIDRFGVLFFIPVTMALIGAGLIGFGLL